MFKVLKKRKNVHNLTINLRRNIKWSNCIDIPVKFCLFKRLRKDATSCAFFKNAGSQFQIRAG